LKIIKVEKASWKLCDNLRLEVIGRIIQYNQEFYNNFTTGEIVEGIDSDIDKIETYIKEALLPIAVNVLNILGIIIVLLNKNRILGVVILVFVCISFALLIREVRKDDHVIIEERISTNQLNGMFGEIIENRIEINVFGRIREVFSKIDEKYSLLKKLKFRRQVFLYRIWIVTIILFTLVNAVSLLIGGFLFFRSFISIGNIYLVYKYIEKLKAPMEEFQNYIQQTIDVKGAVSHLSMLMNFKGKMIEGEKQIVSDEINIKVIDLDFSYDDFNVLHNINLTFRSQEKVGIFGRSGSGKSTLCKIITKQLGIQDGRVFINGIDINQISVNNVMEKIGYITADAGVFDGTIIDNMMIYDSTLNSEKIRHIFENGHLLELFSAFAKKSWEEIIEINLNEALSMGEKQLFTLCRLFFKTKAFYVFDEATSVIEEEVEDQFYRLLNNLIQNAGFILVTHNVERLNKCDRIIVMNEGKVIEQSDFGSLLKDDKSLFSQYSKEEWAMNYE
jgi:ABC-type multidrug transport system fused ATPase/permease subunit